MAFSLSVPEKEGLALYLQHIHAIPLLSVEEEQQLSRRYRDLRDLAAAQTLVLSHVRYVVKIARDYQGYGLALADLIQEGTIGLMKAVKRFDPDKGVRLVTFALHWIKAEIHEFVIRHWRIVKVATTKAQRKLFFQLRKHQSTKETLSVQATQAVAQALAVKSQDVEEMQTRLQGTDLPLAALPDDLPVEERLATCQQEKLQQALSKLDPRSFDIISARWLGEQKVPLKTLAEKYGFSIEYIRKLEKAALKQLLGLLFEKDEAFE